MLLIFTDSIPRNHIPVLLNSIIIKIQVVFHGVFGKVLSPKGKNSMEKMTGDSERLIVASLLSVIGGFLDVYTYLFRGRVFANAVTGNMVLFGLNISQGHWSICGKYILAITCYAIGIFIADLMHKRLSRTRKIAWHQVVLLLEMTILLPVTWIPYGKYDFIVNGLIALVCAMQVQTFRRVKGLPFASTMCTGNLRSGSDALFQAVVNHTPGEFGKTLHYYGIILCFIFGAAIGVLILNHFGKHMIILAPIGLAFIYFLSTPKRKLVQWRSTLRNLKRK